MPEGTYILHPIFLKPKVNLVGENRDTVTLKLSDNVSDDYHRLINMNDNTKVQNITCDGNYQNHPNGIEHMHCIFAWDSDNILIDNNRLKNAVADGISISGSAEASDNVIISNNILKENQRSQIVIEQVNHLQIFNNTIMSETKRPGIHFEPWEWMQYNDAKITGNIITSNSVGYCVLLAGADSGMSAEGATGYYYQGLEFYENTVNCPSGSFLIMDTSGAKVYDNTLNVSEIHVWRKNEDVNIYNNEINGSVRIEGGWDGKLVSTRTNIYGNTINSSNDGVNIHAGAEDTTINNNMFTGSGRSSGVNLFASDDIKNTLVSNNSFIKYHNGVVLDYDHYGETFITGVTVSENTFKDLNEYAFYVEGPVHDVKMNNNVVTNSSGAYINVHPERPMSNIEIISNMISGGKSGIIQQVSDSLNGLIILGNTITNTTGTGDGYITGAAIELDLNSAPPTNVQIKENVLTNNARNFITVPDSILNSVQNNKD